MGFIKEVYSNNRAGLVVAFKSTPNSSTYVNTNDVEEAIKYFNLMLKDNTLYAATDSEVAIQKLEIKPEEANTFREKVNTLLATLDDITAVENTILYPLWSIGQEYKIDERVRYNNILYKVLQDHTSQTDWAPAAAPSLFAKVLTSEDGTILDWVQPDSTNPYMMGDKVHHNGIVWTSTTDNNVWEPGTTGAPWVSDTTEVEQIEDFVAGEPYGIGHRVKFNGLIYESTIDNNIWSPEDYPTGWKEVIV